MTRSSTDIFQEVKMSQEAKKKVGITDNMEPKNDTKKIPLNG